MVSSKAVPEHLNQKFRSKFNHGYLHCAILKALYGFKEKRAHKARDFSFKIFKLRFWRFWNCLKTTRNSPEQPVELTQKLATKATTPHW